MPTYDYKCESCESIHEEFHAMSKAPRIVCAACGGKCRMIYAVGQVPIFKGAGFHCNDYPKPADASSADYVLEEDGQIQPHRKKDHPDGYRWDS